MAALVNYSDSSDESLEDVTPSKGPANSTKITENYTTLDSLETNLRTGGGLVRKKAKLETPQLELPSEILTMFGNSNAKPLDNGSSLHRGRKRTFEHVEGNWATFVCVSCTLDDHMIKLRDDLFNCLRVVGDFQPMDDHHISLSRTVVIRHHWIDPLYKSLKENIEGRKLKSSLCELSNIRIYTNDEKTRSFLGLEVNAGKESLKEFSDLIDEAFKEFRLPSYYKNPSFHLSIGWALGDVTNALSDDWFPKLQTILTAHVEDVPEVILVPVKEIQLKTGNKLFKFTLPE